MSLKRLIFLCVTYLDNVGQIKRVTSINEKAELEKRFKEIASVMYYFSGKRESVIGQIEKLRKELDSIEKTMDEMTKEFLMLVEKLSKK